MVFAIVLSIIASGEHRRLKNLPRISEIEAMLKDVGFVLFIVPLKAHTMSAIARSISNKYDKWFEVGCASLRNAEISGRRVAA